MTDEQFNKLAEALKPHERSNLQRVLDGAFGSVVALLVAGFFGLLWSSSQDNAKSVNDLKLLSSSIDQKIEGVKQTLKTELGNLEPRLAVQPGLKETVEAQNAALKILEQRVITLETRPAQTAAAATPDKTAALLTNAALKLHPIPTFENTAIIEKIRTKEDAIDAKFRQYEQRGPTAK